MKLCAVALLVLAAASVCLAVPKRPPFATGRREISKMLLPLCGDACRHALNTQDKSRCIPYCAFVKIIEKEMGQRATEVHASGGLDVLEDAVRATVREAVDAGQPDPRAMYASFARAVESQWAQRGRRAAPRDTAEAEAARHKANAEL
eukprot:m51a1_g2973 hypothetical protein (148) ;mRNA; f:705917-706431